MPRKHGRRVTIRSGPVLDATVARLTRNGDKPRARSLARLLIEGTPGRVVSEDKRTVTLVFRGSGYAYTVPSGAVRTVRGGKHGK